MSRLNTLDHFLLSGTLYSNAVDSCFALHDVDNSSDHDPVVLWLSLAMNLISFTNRIYSPRISWVKATTQDCYNYKRVLQENLRRIVLPVDAILCKNLNCCCVKHKHSTNAYANDIISACHSAADATIPHTSNQQEGSCIPGWTERVKPLREKSIFWPPKGRCCGRVNAAHPCCISPCYS